MFMLHLSLRDFNVALVSKTDNNFNTATTEQLSATFDIETLTLTWSDLNQLLSHLTAAPQLQICSWGLKDRDLFNFQIYLMAIHHLIFPIPAHFSSQMPNVLHTGKEPMTFYSYLNMVFGHCEFSTFK